MSTIASENKQFDERRIGKARKDSRNLIYKVTGFDENATPKTGGFSFQIENTVVRVPTFVNPSIPLRSGYFRKSFLGILLDVLTFGCCFPATIGAPPLALAWQTTDLRSSQIPGEKSLVTLELGRLIERRIAAGEVHVYQALLAAGQYMRISAEQRDIDVAIRILGPGNEKLAEMNMLSAPRGEERISWIAEQAGTHPIEIHPTTPKVSGTYAIRLAALRAPEPGDRERISAETAFTEAERLRRQGTKESRQQGLQLCEKAIPRWKEVNDSQGEAYTLSLAGRLADALGKRRESVAYTTRALGLHRANKDPAGEGVTLNNLGMFAQQGGDLPKALEYLKEGLTLRRAAGDRYGQAQTLNNLGGMHQEMSEFVAARDFYAQALQLYKAVGERQGEAIILNNVGGVHRALGEYQRALDCHLQALPIRRELEDREGEGITLNNIGGIYAALGDHSKAVEYLEPALRTYRLMGDRRREAQALNSLGVAYRNAGRNESAAQHLKEALALRRAAGDRRGESITLNNLAGLYQRMGDEPKALEQFTASLQLKRALADRRGEAVTLRNLGTLYQSMGESQKALGHLHEALKLSEAVKDRDLEAETLAELARAEQAKGNLAESRVLIERSLKMMESQRIQMASPDLRASYFAEVRKSFEFYIDLLMRLHQGAPSGEFARTAFDASEQARARSLLEMLTESEAGLVPQVDPALREREKLLHARLGAIQNRFIQADSSVRSERAKTAALESELQKTENELSLLQLEIQGKDPRYADLQHPKPVHLTETQQMLPDRSILLEYALGKQASFLFAVTRREFEVFRLPGSTALEERITKLRQALAQPGRTGLSNYITQATALHGDLLAPADRLLAGKQELIVAPDGILHYLPFEVLLTRDRKVSAPSPLRELPYLVRDFSILYAPSASVLAHLQRGRQEPMRPDKALLAYADPAYGEQQPAASSPVGGLVRSAFGEQSSWKLSRLEHSRKEAEAIARLFPREQATLYLGADAREENVKVPGRLGQYRILHFATHGILNENRPQLSGLVLSLSQSGGLDHGSTAPAPKTRSEARSDSAPATDAFREDGLLQVYEIFKLKLNADLVVLSACETGLGKEVRGEGLIGLTRAFLYAGTSSVVVSLWKVADQSTAELMIPFYKRLRDGVGKAEALRQAQLEMIRKGRFAHPYYWAPFVLVGQP